MAIYSNVITNSSGSVGIGTTDVKEKLQVYGDLKVGVLAAGSFISLADESSTARYVGIYRSAGDTLLGLGAWGGIKFHASNTSLGSQTEWMRLDTSGRLGIGVTNPTNILTINKGNGTGINVQYDNATNVRTGLFLFTRGSSIGGFSGGSEWDDSTTTARSTAASSLLASAGTLLFYTNTSLTSGNTFTPSERMRIDTSGNVGIGVTAPPSLLSIDSASSHTVNDLVFTFDSAGNYRNGISNNMNSGNLDGNKMMFNVCNTSTTVSNLVMTLTGRSRVGIGDTAPAYKFVVGQGETTQTGQMFIAAQLNSSGKGLVIDTNTRTTADNAVLALEVINNTGGNTLAATVAGNVGIGTTIPGYPLHVYKSGLADGSTNTHLMFDGKFSAAGIDQNDMIGMSSRLENSGGGSQTTFNIGFSYQAGANAILLQPTSGYVGIGTNNPSSKLHVVSGDIRFNNTYGIIGATNTAGNVLRADGTRFVPAQLSYSDLSTSSMPVRTVSYTSITGATGDWFPIFRLGTSNTTGAAICTLSTPSHSSVTFTVNRGWYNSDFYTISVLNCIVNENGGFPTVREVRIVRDSVGGANDGWVEARLYWGSGPTVNVNASVMMSPINDITFAGSLATSTATIGGTVSVGDSVAFTSTNQNILRAKGNIITPSRIGIGTTDPSYKLHVVENGNPQVWISATNAGSNSAGISFENQGQRNWQIWADRTNDRLQIGNNSRATVNLAITADSNVGIGTVTPSARLHVQGSTTTSTPTFLVRENQAMATSTALADFQNSSSTSLMFLSGSGWFGLGTNSPSQKMHISNNGSVYTQWQDTSGGGLIGYVGASVSSGVFDISSPSPIRFWVNNSERARINTSGDVGIGTATYTGRLYVSGSSTSATPTIVGRAGIPTPSGALLDLQNNEGTTAFLVNYQGSVRAGTSGAGMVLDFRTNGANRLDLQFSDGASWYVNPDRSTGSFINFFENTLGAQVYIGNRNADAVNTLRDGSPLYLSTRYWNGSASVAVSPSIQALVDSTSPDYRMRLLAGTGQINIRSNGYVGIGKTNPAYTLDVTGDINYTSALKLGGVNVLFNTSTDVYANIRVLQNNSTASQDGMYINYNSTGTSAANLRFYANGTNLRMQIDAATGHTLPGTDNAYDLGTSGVRWRTLYLSNTLSAATVTASGLTQGSVVFAGSGGTLSQDNTKLFWDNSNKRLGIGNSAPGYPLDVTGTSRYTGIAYYDGGESINLYGIRGRFSGEAMHLYNKVAIGYPSGWGGDISTTPIYGLSTYGGAILAYNQGTVGIGTATSSVRLYVHGSSTATTPTMLVKEGVASPTNGVLAFEVEKSTGATIFAVSGSGFVGVGTSNPAGTFEVVGVSGSLLLVTDNLSGSLFSVNDVTGLPILEVFSDDTVVAGRVNTNALVVTGSIVGIGTRTPSNTLDVNGTVRVRSVSNATGNFATYSGTGVLQQRTAAEVKTDLSLNDVQNLSVSQIFNNTGAGHSTRTDFANITDFGYQYVKGTTNGPNLNSATQYYAWTIGLGSEYSYANYGAQFAIPRAVANPYMGVRYREATTWSSWHKLAAGNADTLTTARTLWGQSFDGSGNVTGNLTSVGNITGTGAVTLTATGGTLGLTATGANVITATTNGTEALRINSSQNVGIGTATVGTRLHVHSGATDEVARFESTGNPYISLYDTGARQGYLYSNTSSVELVAENSKPLYLQGATEIRLRTNTSTDRVIINSGGVVGIGYTPPITTATSKLMVASDITLAKANASLQGNLYYDGAGPGWKYAANGYGWGFREDNAGKLQMVRAGNNTSGADAAASISLTDLFTFDLVNNRVGLGTGSPTTKFHVLHTSNDPVMIEQTTDTAWNRIYFKKPTRSWTLGPDNSTGTNNLFVLADETAGAYRVTVDTSGNVGINTSSMSRKLVVHGSDALINDITIGRGGLSPSATSSTNTVLGNSTFGQATSSQVGNVAVGYLSLNNATTGADGNVAVGALALNANTTAKGNVGIGYYALSTITTASGSSAVGYEALKSATGADNTAIGWLSAQGLTTGAGSVAIGTRSLRRGTGGLANTATGTTAVGAYALENGNASSGTTAVGWLAGGLGDMTGWYNTLVGGAAGAALTTAAGVTALGYGAMYFTTTGGDNTAIGNASLYKTTTGAFNVGLGNYSLYNNQVSYLNTAIGYRSLYTQTSGFSIVVGAATLSYGLNTAVGYETLVSSSSGYSNTAVGHSAGSKVTTGISNTLLGYTAGSEITTGNYNVVVGGYTAASFATSSNNIFLSDGAGNLRMIVDSSGRVGIGTTNPSEDLEAFGTDAGIIAHYSGQSRGGIWAFSGARVAFATTTSGDDLVFGYTGSPGTSAGFVERMRIANSTGRVGIGTSPSGLLHTGTGEVWFYNSPGTDHTHFSYGTTGDNYLTHGNDGTFNGATYIRGKSPGGGSVTVATFTLNTGVPRVGIGTAATTYYFRLGADSAAKPLTNTWTIASDRRLKENIQTIRNPLERFLRLRGVEFDWKEKLTAVEPKKRHSGGFIAQELEEAGFDHWVNEVEPDEDEKNYIPQGMKKDFSMGPDFYALTVESIRSLKSENDSLKSEIQSLKDQISSILALLNNK